MNIPNCRLLCQTNVLLCGWVYRPLFCMAEWYQWISNSLILLSWNTSSLIIKSDRRVPANNASRLMLLCGGKKQPCCIWSEIWKRFQYNNSTESRKWVGTRTIKSEYPGPCINLNGKIFWNIITPLYFILFALKGTSVIFYTCIHIQTNNIAHGYIKIFKNMLNFIT